jgi:Ca2+-binding EF-hand superfamily protein
LMRRFDNNNDGVISMEEFYNTLASVAHWEKFQLWTLNNFFLYLRF